MTEMKRGLVIGKFMPLHQGHVALIKFARAQCDELIVSMSYTLNDPIHHDVRLQWIQEIFGIDPQIMLASSLDDFDDDALGWPDRTRIWAKFIETRFPSIDVLFSSEEYGDHFAKNLRVPHVAFDPQRLQFPISATQIRQSPLKSWSFLPEVVRPYFVKKVCFYGAESTGKSTMAKRMAEIFNTEFVPEVARELITSNDFTVDDIIRIGHAQTQRVIDKSKTANKILFCDTDVITTQIYSRHYLNVVPEVLFELEKQIHYDAYFFFDIDTAWLADGLRDLGNKRTEMSEIFRSELVKRKIHFEMVRGTWAEKENFVKERVHALLR